LIIYDFDDNVYLSPNFKEIIKYVDVITTNTIFGKNYIKIAGYNKPCYLLEDSIDYSPQKMEEPNKNDNKICWFGNSRYFYSIRWMLNYIDKANLYEIDIISGRFLYKNCKRTKNYNNLNIIRWRIDNFVENIIKNSISIMSHKGRYRKKIPFKSNHKMITAITYGLPCIVSNSIEYEKLAKQFNLDYSIVNNEEELKNALNYLNFYENRKKYLKNIQPYIWEKYHPETVAKKLWTIIKKHL
jgi:hypothetical protein